ncbi:hypothetical protein STRTUCAR8_08587 [Streptomyces turgidiscabies Car8]|uniref:Uncharacterized protein n=1 Tax=Streptomyces turgidiscabies (strain Car8) TaxID=698760 RepID=L7F9F7_STRT8|nr:hypothetical protein [Streptomyces turgidiscabies]ELP67671.1 hypothetical protein STRTUCAR8_08587 [Streptomyces turgidiscabies Car8]
MAWFRRTEQSTRTYPAAGASVTGDASRFRRAKTSGARQAGAEAERWEQRDRARDRTDGGWRITNWRD